MQQYIFIFISLCFLLSLWCIFIARQNLIVIFIAIEIMILSMNFLFIYLSNYFDDLLGLILFFILLCLAGAEASISLSILIVIYRLRGLISLYILSYLKN